MAPATTAASVVPNRPAIASRLSEVAGSELLAATVQGRVGNGKPTPANSWSATAVATSVRAAPVAAAIEARVSDGPTT